MRAAPDAVRTTLHGSKVVPSSTQTFWYTTLTRSVTQLGLAAAQRDLKAPPPQLLLGSFWAILGARVGAPCARTPLQIRRGSSLCVYWLERCEYLPIPNWKITVKKRVLQSIAHVRIYVLRPFHLNLVSGYGDVPSAPQYKRYVFATIVPSTTQHCLKQVKIFLFFGVIRAVHALAHTPSRYVRRRLFPIFLRLAYNALGDPRSRVSSVWPEAL